MCLGQLRGERVISVPFSTPRRGCSKTCKRALRRRSRFGRPKWVLQRRSSRRYQGPAYFPGAGSKGIAAGHREAKQSLRKIHN
jgi:hypothetical protein